MTIRKPGTPAAVRRYTSTESHWQPYYYNVIQLLMSYNVMTLYNVMYMTLYMYCNMHM